MKPIEVQCEYCQKTFLCGHAQRLRTHKHLFCSRHCEAEWRKQQNLNMVCPVCGKAFHAKPSYIAKAKHELCCSRKCLGEYRSKIYLAENNPNYGNRGSKNPIWKSDIKYKLGYKWIKMPDHPLSDKKGFILEHRLVAEQYLLTPETSIEIDGKQYLSPDFVVHHKDHDRLNNDPSNLAIMTMSEHAKLHQKEIREKKLAS